MIKIIMNDEYNKFNEMCVQFARAMKTSPLSPIRLNLYKCKIKRKNVPCKFEKFSSVHTFDE